jgi:hypothetical protein
VHGQPDAALERLLEGPRRVALRPSLRVTTREADGSSRERVGFIVGSGLVAQFFGLYYERGAPGYGGSARLVAQIFAESFVGGAMARRVLAPMACELSVDGETLEVPAWSLICASVVRNLGIHMLLTHRAGEDPHRPHLVATPLPPRQLGPRAPLVLAGRALGGDHNVDQLVQHFRIRFPERGAFVLDGELLEAAEVEVEAGPRLRIVTAT